MATIVKPPASIPKKISDKSVFLAGSIEMGKAEDWQSKVERLLTDEDVMIFNPRRDDWDSSWEQKIENDQFREQVEWELTALELSDLILLYFDPTTKSPISLLELGLHADDKKLVVCCPDGFWRKGNVDIVCKRYGIPQVKDVDGLVAVAKKWVTK